MSQISRRFLFFFGYIEEMSTKKIELILWEKKKMIPLSSGENDTSN